ncbi:uncharacterized protein B0H64DRAFT_373201 [Chaetomium fimeti]|uniref:Senescence domain-containing protein n=1 Tax=Chaetomium fimeti TaxID=1854472 RepID=A0AAE0HJW0_9PEZI|nr:hypothetical protein B0H64DRAFT_373201 [Chaetomium fimeti]
MFEGSVTDRGQLRVALNARTGPDPVEITLPAAGGQNINVAPISADLHEADLHPAYKSSFLVSNASATSRHIITGSGMLSKLLQNQADNFTKNVQPSAKPMPFKPATVLRVTVKFECSLNPVGIRVEAKVNLHALTKTVGPNIQVAQRGRIRDLGSVVPFRSSVSISMPPASKSELFG